ncbi:hypothetical protein [Hamadaea tsunoensis]|uniref:hypothetical protein n=1 Tax=Hamadaea tsunoensis TaxID=53368 RepID=UPI00042A547A|nr:hypothetical protein [Hamadaea tsunoensis]
MSYTQLEARVRELEDNHVRKLGEDDAALYDMVKEANTGVSTVGRKVAALHGEFTEFRAETVRRFDTLETRIEEVDARAQVRADDLERSMNTKFFMAEHQMRVEFAKADAKMDRGFAAADERMNQLNSKIDGVHSELTQKVDTLGGKIDLILDHLKIG